jgi:hypothetical protein
VFLLPSKLCNLNQVKKGKLDIVDEKIAEKGRKCREDKNQKLKIKSKERYSDLSEKVGQEFQAPDRDQPHQQVYVKTVS